MIAGTVFACADSALVAEVRPAVNRDARPAGTRPDTVVLHYTGMRTARAALDWLTCEQSRVSCHYLIDEDGSIIQMVPEAERAWHAGVSIWRGRSGLNAHSVGIELVNPGHEFGYRPFPDEQIEAVIALLLDLQRRLAFVARDLVAHSDIAPTRKQDPGELFPWQRLHAEGLGLWLPPQAPDGQGEAIAEALGTIGYGVEGGRDASLLRAATAAFQRRWRPSRVDGEACPQTAATARAVAALYRSPAVT